MQNISDTVCCRQWTAPPGVPVAGRLEQELNTQILCYPMDRFLEVQILRRPGYDAATHKKDSEKMARSRK